MDFAEMYYKTKWGSYPFETYENYDKTSSFIEHLVDNNFTEEEIANIIDDSKKSDYMSIDSVNNNIWDPYLTEKGEFYFHNTLRIQPPKPKWNPITNEVSSEKNYLEMKIKYTLEDLLNYFYIVTNMPPSLMDKNRDRAGLNYLLKRFSILEGMTSLDFVLHLIDTTKILNKEIFSAVELSQFSPETLGYVETVISEADFYDVNKIVWRG